MTTDKAREIALGALNAAWPFESRRLAEYKQHLLPFIASALTTARDDALEEAAAELLRWFPPDSEPAKSAAASIRSLKGK